MGGWSLNGFGPQKRPASIGRLRAMWMQLTRDNAKCEELNSIEKNAAALTRLRRRMDEARRQVERESS
jgi:hypothetical protein